MATLVCVLRSGGRYTPDWVARLSAGVVRLAPGITRFVCLSDLDLRVRGIETVPLVCGWPGWWSKMEAFRPDLSDGTTVFCDLDTVFAGPAPELAEPGAMAMEDYFLSGRLSSALMRWEGNEFAFLFEEFSRDPERWMRPGSCGTVPNSVHGDRVVIDHLLRRRGRLPPFVQHRYPGLLEFYDPAKAVRGSLVIFIGDSKPDRARQDIQAMWRGAR